MSHTNIDDVIDILLATYILLSVGIVIGEGQKRENDCGWVKPYNYLSLVLMEQGNRSMALSENVINVKHKLV